jgi:hypothetical protein
MAIGLSSDLQVVVQFFKVILLFFVCDVVTDEWSMGIGGMVSLSAVGIISVQMSYSMATSHQQGGHVPYF